MDLFHTQIAGCLIYFDVLGLTNTQKYPSHCPPMGLSTDHGSNILSHDDVPLTPSQCIFFTGSAASFFTAGIEGPAVDVEPHTFTQSFCAALLGLALFV